MYDRQQIKCDVCQSVTLGSFHTPKEAAATGVFWPAGQRDGDDSRALCPRCGLQDVSHRHAVCQSLDARAIDAVDEIMNNFWGPVPPPRSAGQTRARAPPPPPPAAAAEQPESAQPRPSARRVDDGDESSQGDFTWLRRPPAGLPLEARVEALEQSAIDLAFAQERITDLEQQLQDVLTRLARIEGERFLEQWQRVGPVCHAASDAIANEAREAADRAESRADA